MNPTYQSSVIYCGSSLRSSNLPYYSICKESNSFSSFKQSQLLDSKLNVFYYWQSNYYQIICELVSYKKLWNDQRRENKFGILLETRLNYCLAPNKIND